MKPLTLDTADRLAKKFRADNGLSLKEAINLKSLLRKLNILTLFSPLSNDFYGMSILSPNGLRFLLINSNNQKGRQHFTIAHELYHLFLDENPRPHICRQADGSKNISETQADLFASALLMPEEGLLDFISKEEIINRTVHLATVIRMEQYYSVSRLALLIKLKSCKLITEARLEELRVQVKDSAKQYGYDTSLYEPGNEGLIIGDFGEKARLLFEKEIISEGHYVGLLNLITNAKD